MDRPSPGALARALVVLLGAALFAGCTDSSEPTGPLLQETVEAGETLFGFQEADHFGPHPTSMERCINGSFEVPPEITSFGVGFQGVFDWPNSTASLQVRDPDEEVVLELFAERGGEDDEGVIASLFEFHRLSTAQTPGKWRILAVGTGNISSLEFRVHGLHAHEDVFEHTFEVPSGDMELRLRVEAAGWGETPRVQRIGPDGAVAELDLPGPRDRLVVQWRAAAGEHVLLVDPSGWGGRLSMQVTPV